MAKIRLKKGDEVVVLAGELAERRGAVLEIDTKKERVRIDGGSKGKKKTVKKTPLNPQGGVYCSYSL